MTEDIKMDDWKRSPFYAHAKLLVLFPDPTDTSVFQNESDDEDMSELGMTGRKTEGCNFDPTAPKKLSVHGFSGVNPLIFKVSAFETKFNTHNAPDMFISCIFWCKTILYVHVKGQDPTVAEEKLLETMSLCGWDKK